MSRRLRWLAAFLVVGLLMTGLVVLSTPPTPASDRTVGDRAASAALAEAAARSDTLLVGVLVRVDTATVFVDGPSRLVEPGTGRTLARADAYRPWRFLVAGGGATAWGPWGELERSADRLRVVPEDGDARVFLDGRPYPGQAEVVHLAAAGTGGSLVVASRVVREAYLRSVVSGELGDEAETAPAAARAQAVAARTYAVAFTGLRARDSLGVDLLADPEADQSYPGLLADREAAARAVRETRGRILTWRGAPALAFYHSTCGGRTARPAAAWPGLARAGGEPDLGPEAAPYLAPVADAPGPGEDDFCAASPHHRWRRAWTQAEVRRALLPALAGAAGRDPGALARLVGAEVTGRSEHGRVTELSVVVAPEGGRRLDTLRLPPPRLPRALPSADGEPLLSTWFEVVPPAEGEALALEGRGSGHGVGMCQWGALERAHRGAGWREILAVYYPGTEVARLPR